VATWGVEAQNAPVG